RAAAIVSSPIGDLADHHVVVKPVPLRQTCRQQLQQGGNIQTTEESDSRGCLARLTGAQHFAKLLQASRAQFFDYVDHAVTLIAAHAAKEPVSEMFHRCLRCAAQYLKQILRYLR